MRYLTWMCSREGKSSTKIGSLKLQETIQTGCLARLTTSAHDYGIWGINTVNLEHNHKTSSTKSRLYRCNRELSAQVKRRLQVNDIVGISLHKSYNVAVVEAGGYETSSAMILAFDFKCVNNVAAVLTLCQRTPNSFFASFSCKASTQDWLLSISYFHIIFEVMYRKLRSSKIYYEMNQTF
ncbi:uncharacterized protein LOC111383468 isoform X1 [Olea europaea var. sylvestris]|uniref:uncharacterized protein LOC111383468 isoform X1 n=1 Tax=Olea europaea var. sylvestris TaxID=158386 RepID=UPI000C1D6851|nr:uncharacterized protein LOC111383468 isoform X1 [Olea europaea var. sylvestris]